MDFERIIDNFVSDICISFPEYVPTLKKWWKKDVSVEKKEKIMKFIKKYCIHVYKPLYNQIINEDEHLFDGEAPLELLPQICFRKIWKCQLTPSTKKCLWGHIKLVCLMSVNLTNETTPTVEAKDNILNKIQEQFKDSKMGELMKDITENILNDNTIKSPMDLLTDPSKLMKIMERTQTLLSNKVEKGDLSENEILNNMKDTMKTLGANNPMLGNLFNVVSSQLGGDASTSIDEMLKETNNDEELLK